MMYTSDCKVDSNIAHLCGEVKDELVFSHKTYGESFYTFVLSVMRNSGYEDNIVIMVSERIIGKLDICPGEMIIVDGQIRTYNEDVNGKNKLNIVVFAKEIENVDFDEEPFNQIYLDGFICKQPVGRISPLGRRICDIMLAVNRLYNKSDYIPCIAWGRNAIYGEDLDVGDHISITGRLQSREYRKKREDGSVENKVAYEVSILQLEKSEEW
ncbi:MAG: single-stranded DNA-binding protein [Eubacteriaceae bacterium]|nr:single-stranded DNA-binding protein [Eubacteriaceae bacterium]